MKFCPSCGGEVHDQAVICVHCGVSLAANVVSDKRYCSSCGAECHKDAVICVGCGQLLEKKPVSGSAAVAEGIKKAGSGKVVWVIALILCGIGAISLLANFIRMISRGEDFIYILTAFLSLISSGLIVGGFIVRKSSPLPGIGYIISAATTALSTIVSMVDYGFTFGLFMSLVSVIQIALVARLYLDKNNAVRQKWLIPVVMCVAITVITIVGNLIDGAYDSFSGYYYTYSYFDSELFITDLLSKIGGVLGVVVTCLNAKYNWNRPEQEIPANTIYQ